MDFGASLGRMLGSRGRGTRTSAELPRPEATYADPNATEFARRFRHHVSAKLIKTRRIRIDYLDRSHKSRSTLAKFGTTTCCRKPFGCPVTS